MANNASVKKDIEILLKKVEALENQSFAQKLAIDELENKLQLAEDQLKQLKQNPFGLSVPFVQPTPYIPNKQLTYPYVPSNNPHVCTPGLPDYAGTTYCTTCGGLIISGPWTITTTTCNTTTDSTQSPTGIKEDTQS